jgi:hypothetical protein
MATEPAAFAPQSFHDLVRLLEQHPEWRAQLRQLVLTEELLQLPVLVRELAEAQKRTDEQLAALAEAQRGTEEALRALVQRVDRLDDRVGELVGWSLEERYRDHSGAYFGPLVRRARVIPDDELDDLLEAAEVAGTMREEEARDVRLADLIMRGRRPSEDEVTYLVVEVSAGIGQDDVKRAAYRAALRRKLRPTLAVVAGNWATAEAQEIAHFSGVWQVLDGRVIEPKGA